MTTAPPSPAAPASTPPPLSKPPELGFRLRRYVYVLWGVTTLIFILSALFDSPPPGSEAYSTGYLIGQIVGAFIFPILFALIPGAIAFFVTGRRTTPLNFTMAIALCLLVVIGAISLAVNMIQSLF